MNARRCAVVAVVLGLRAGVAAHGAEVELTFRPLFEAEPVRLDTLRYTVAKGETLSVTRLSLLLSSFGIEKPDGTSIQSENQFAFLDLETRRLNHRFGNVPPGSYRALRFTVGLDPRTNGSDPSSYPPDHPLNPNLNRLHWSWQGGYIFFALEGHRRTPQALDAWSLHFARDSNRTVVTLPVSFEVASAAVVAVDVDLASLLCGTKSVSLLEAGNSTHSRDGDPVSAALRENLPRAFRARELAGRRPREDSASSLSSLHQSVGLVERGQAGSTVPPSSPARGTDAGRAGEEASVPRDLPLSATPYPLQINARFPIPDLPRDNPLTVDRVALGRRLFHEPLLSRTGALSCTSCHDAAHGFSDPRRRSIGVNGTEGARQSMPLFNLAWKSSFFWDGRAPSLREQVLQPIADHREMDESLDRVVAKLEAQPDYPTLFAKAFASPGLNAERIGLALENFLLTLISDGSRFDDAMRGEASLGVEEQRGLELFFTEYDPRSRQFGADCFHCHGGALFSDHQFHSNGLADPHDPGRFAATGRESDRGKFATPSLRNVALTAPYMHDGRFATLEEAVAHYVTGVEPSLGLDPNLAKHPGGRVPLSSADQRALVAFLKTLSDPELQPGSEPVDGGVASVAGR